MKKMIILLLIFFTPCAFPLDNPAPIVFQNETYHWISLPNLPDGVKVAYLLGDPRKKQSFVARVKLPANYFIPIHAHNADKIDTVISGALYLGMQSKKNSNQGQLLTTGCFVMIPAKIPHYEWTQQETILQISGIGPWDMMKTNKNTLID
jgi:quercetin dioxygenase-like cupin family protein